MMTMKYMNFMVVIFMVLRGKVVAIMVVIVSEINVVETANSLKMSMPSAPNLAFRFRLPTIEAAICCSATTSVELNHAVKLAKSNTGHGLMFQPVTCAQIII